MCPTHGVDPRVHCTVGKKAAEELLEAVETGGTVDKYIQVKETGLTREGSIINLSTGPDDHLHGAG